MIEWLNKPKHIRTFNAIFTAVWVVLIWPTITVWHQSILWVGFISIWANIVSHYTAYLTARVEVREEDVQESLDVA